MSRYRRLCTCDHARRDHARFALEQMGRTFWVRGQCLAVVDDPDRSALITCWCHGYQERPARRVSR